MLADCAGGVAGINDDNDDDDGSTVWFWSVVESANIMHENEEMHTLYIKWVNCLFSLSFFLFLPCEGVLAIAATGETESTGSARAAFVAGAIASLVCAIETNSLY